MEDHAPSLKNKLIRFVAVSALALVAFTTVIIAAAFISSGDKIADAANNLIDNVMQGNCSVLYAESADIFQEEVDETDWITNCGEVYLRLKDGLVEPKLLETDKSNNGSLRGDAVFFITDNDGVSHKILLSMVKDEDTWKLDNFAYNQESN